MQILGCYVKKNTVTLTKSKAKQQQKQKYHPATTNSTLRRK